MILKSYELENNINNIIKFNLILIYGENIGLKESLKKKIISINKKSEVINLYQEDLLKNKKVLTSEIENISLFVESKLIIINQTTDKLINNIEEFANNEQKIKIVLIAEPLDKKSKLRTFFEKENNLAVIPCYNDNEITLKKLIKTELKDFKNLDSNTINSIINYSNTNRKTVMNNLDKIKIFFEKKIILDEDLEILLNTDKNVHFENIRDAALEGNKNKLNDLFGTFTFTIEDTHLYLNLINYRLHKLLEIHREKSGGEQFDETLNRIKPPIFWKDKPTYLNLLYKWDKRRVLDAIHYLGKVDNNIKNNSNVDKPTQIKNSITNICSNSWNYF